MDDAGVLGRHARTSQTNVGVRRATDDDGLLAESGHHGSGSLGDAAAAGNGPILAALRGHFSRAARAVTGSREERAQVRRTMERGVVDPTEVERLVRVRDYVAETGGLFQALSKVSVERTCVRQAIERVPVACRCPQIRLDAPRNGKVDDDLYRLPEMKHDRVRGVGSGAERLTLDGKLFTHARQVPFHGGNTLREHVDVQTHRSTLSNTSA